MDHYRRPYLRCHTHISASHSISTHVYTDQARALHPSLFDIRGKRSNTIKSLALRDRSIRVPIELRSALGIASRKSERSTACYMRSHDVRRKSYVRPQMPLRKLGSSGGGYGPAASPALARSRLTGGGDIEKRLQRRRATFVALEGGSRTLC